MQGISSRSSERRISARYRPDGEWPLIQMMLGPHPEQAIVNDFSSVGLALVLTDRVEPKTLLPVGVWNHRGKYWHLKVIRVVHTTPAGDGGWIVGGSFLTPFTDHEFEGLHQPRPLLAPVA